MTAFYKIIIVYDLIICIETFNIPIYGRSAERRPLTAGAVNTDADVDPAISPDGRRLAFVRIITLYSSRVMWMPLGAEYRAAAQLREIGTPGPSLHFRSGVIRFTAGATSRMLLYRANHAGHALVNMHIQTSGGLALDRKNGRLLYTSGQLIQNLVRISVNGGASQAPERLTSTSGMDVLQRFSPDGKNHSIRVSAVFPTAESGRLRYNLPSVRGCSSRYATLAPGDWVPDGRSLAYFVARPKGDRQVFRLAMEPARSHAC